MTDYFAPVVLVVSIASVTLAYLLGLKLGAERERLRLNMYTASMLDILVVGWDLLSLDSKFYGLLENVLRLHRALNDEQDVWPIRNVRDLVDKERGKR